MAKHDLIAILSGEHDLSSMGGVISDRYDGFTIVCDAEKTPLMRFQVDRRTALRDTVVRQKKLEELMVKGTVLPALPRQPIDDNHAAALVQANRPYLERLMARFAGMVQYQLNISWKQDGVLARFRQTPEIAPLFGEKSTTGTKVADAVQRLQRRLSTEIAGQLADLATEMIDLPCETDTLLNASLLISATDAFKIDHALETIDAIWTEGLRIRLIGPAPAGSFASLCLEEVTSQMIADAAKLLTCPDNATLDQISRARKAVLQTSEPGQADAIRRAADILCAASRLSPRQSSICLLNHWSEGVATVGAQRQRVA